MMRGRVWPIVAVLVGCAPCSPTEEPRARGVPVDASAPRVAASGDEGGSPPPARPRARKPQWPSLEVRELPPAEETPEEDEPERRDLVAELEGALGGVAGCVKGAAGQVPERTRVQVTVYVTGGGVVSRASVRAPGWPNDARRCVERRARQVRFRAPVPGAPRSVTAALTVHAPPPPPPRDPRDEPWQPSSGVPITDVPGLEPRGPQGEMIDDVPGLEPSGPQGEMIDDVPGLEPSGPQGRPPSH